MKLKKLIAATIATAMAFSVAPVTVPNQAKAATATITLSGSTSVSPLAQQLAKQYAKETKGVKINFTNIRLRNRRRHERQSRYRNVFSCTESR